MCQAMLSPLGQAISKDTDRPFTENPLSQSFMSSIKQIIAMFLTKEKGTTSHQQLE